MPARALMLPPSHRWIQTILPATTSPGGYERLFGKPFSGEVLPYGRCRITSGGDFALHMPRHGRVEGMHMQDLRE